MKLTYLDKMGGGPGGIRTLGPSVKSRLLYLAELRAPRVWREIWSLYISFSNGEDIHSPALASLAPLPVILVRRREVRR